MELIELLLPFGLTQQEAKLYGSLHRCGLATGYELAKATGISRSNAYAGLASLVEKGAAYQVDGTPIRYRAVPAAEFCGAVIRSLRANQAALESALSAPDDPAEAYLTLKGSRNIRSKIETLMEQTQYRIYLSMAQPLLQSFLPPLQKLVEQGKKVVVITNAPVTLAGAAVYLTRQPIQHIRLISDSAKALTGGLTESPGCTCLYSCKENLVNLIKDSIKNEIELIKLSGGDVQ